MKVTSLNSASVLIEDNSTQENVKILCDPWLVGEEYFGSWGMYPPYEFKSEKFDDVDFIYISHIHPDHCSKKTLQKLNKKIPVIIHNFPDKSLKFTIESLGFEVIEVEHNLRIRLKKNVFINILAADNCDPNICGKLMGCGLLETKFGTTQIDTMSIIDNEKEVIVNTNDCPFQIAKNTAKIVKSLYSKIDLLLVGYVKASSYPQTFELEEGEKIKESLVKQEQKLETTKEYIDLFEPKYYIPFAGRYTLVGKFSNLNLFRGEPELEYAFEWLKKRISQEKHKGIILNHDEYFDISKEQISKEYKVITIKEKQQYIDNILSKKIFDYEKEIFPNISELIKLIHEAYKNFELTRKTIGWISDTTIILHFNSIKYRKTGEPIGVAISCNGNGIQILIEEKDITKIKKYLLMSLDLRLLKWLLQGPKKAHWGLVDIGCHIKYKRVPNTYERALYYCWNRFFVSNSQV
jgi:UDP-MurNAc hydroxylase